MNRSLQEGTLRLAAAVALTLPAAAGAVTESGGAAGDWLSRYTGARTVGLGSAYVAAASSPIGVVWNPGTLGFLDQNEVMLETAQLFEGTSLHGFSFAVPGRWLPSLGFSMVALRSGEFEKTNELNESLGTFSDGETAFLFTVSKHVGTRMSLGANCKVVRQSIEDASAGGFGVDLGGLVNLTPRVRAGFSVLNIGGPSLTLRDIQESFPAEMRGGLAVQLLGGRGLISAELDRRGELPVSLHSGAEYWIQRNVGLRVGYDNGFAAGGMSYCVTPQVRFDYGVSDHTLGLTHRVGVAYRFGGFFASAKALPVVFSPTGDQPVTQVQLQAHTKSDADRWTLDFVNKSDEVVRRFGGQGVPPPHVLWDGKDENGLPLGDGVYRYSLVVYDRDGRVLKDTTRTVEISTSGPQGAVPVEVH